MRRRTYIEHNEFRARREGVIVGAAVGVFISMIVLTLSAVAVDLFQTRQSARAVAQAQFTGGAALAACQAKLLRVSEAVALADQIDAAQGRAPR